MSSLLGAGLIGSFYQLYPPQNTPENIRKVFQAGCSMGEAWIAASSIADVAFTLFSFTYGGFLGFLGTISGTLDLALNYDTWKLCQNGEKASEKTDTFDFVNEKDRTKKDKKIMSLVERVSENTIFWKAVSRLVGERIYSVESSRAK